MPIFHRDNSQINYETLGHDGNWVVLTPGGRGSLEDVRDLGNQIAADGYRVLLHDRRNCGKSSVHVTANDLSEQEIWADDVHALLASLNALPVIAGGGSAGCRLSLLLTMRHPGSTRGLLLWWVTGGQHAAVHLGHQYYGQFINAAKEGGMAAVVSTDFFRARIQDRPANRDYLLAMDPIDFIATMSAWQSFFLEGAELPVIGATREQLEAIFVPACIIPGNDDIHPRAVGTRLAELLPVGELAQLWQAEEIAKIREMAPTELMPLFRQRMAQIFISFLRSHKL